jgi:hypothetical protein
MAVADSREAALPNRTIGEEAGKSRESSSSLSARFETTV